jgi:glycosyltransferase involved in cell wall biosynthesis
VTNTELEEKIMAKRVCLVRHGFYPDDLLVRREAIALRDYGFDVDVLSSRGRDQAAMEDIDGIHVRSLPLRRSKGTVIRYLYDYLSFFLLAAVILTIRHLRRPYAFIQVNTMPDFLVFATLIPRLLGAKIILQMYEPTPELWATRLGLTQEQDLEQAEFGQKVFIRALRWIQQISLRYVHAAFAVTQQLKDNFVSYGADPDKITVVLNVPDPRFFRLTAGEESQESQTATASDHFALICHGAIEERYGHDTMLQAIAALRSSIPGLQLRITGSGSYRDEFLAQVKALGLQDHVQYLGFVPLTQLVAELRQADVGIVAQKSSVYSNLVHTGKMYDYLDLGKPVIASRLRAVEAYFDDDSLCFFEAGNSGDLARAILGLYEEPNRRSTLISNAQQLYEQYRWEVQREEYWSAYARLDC